MHRPFNIEVAFPWHSRFCVPFWKLSSGMVASLPLLRLLLRFLLLFRAMPIWFLLLFNKFSSMQHLVQQERRQFPKQSFHIQHTGGAEFSQQSFQDGIVHKRSQIFYNSVLKVEFKLPSLHQILHWGKWKWNKNQKSTFGRRTSGHCKQLLDAAFWFSYWIWNLPEIDESG